MCDTTKLTKSAQRAQNLRDKRRRMTQNQSGHCYYCNGKVWVRGHDAQGKPNKEATLEHLVPVSHGGKSKDHKDNLVIACAHCNRTRGTYPAEDFKRIRRMKAWDKHWKEYRQKVGESHKPIERIRYEERQAEKRKSKGFYRETINRIKPFRAFVYV